jgi:hypothetical protein
MKMTGANTVRVSVYSAIMIVSVILVIMRQDAVRKARGQKVVSDVQQWKENGKPVTAEKIVPKDVKVFTKFSVVRDRGEKRLKGFVTADIKNELKPGDDIYYGNDPEKIGKVSAVSDEMDIDTGMYQIDVDIGLERRVLVLNAHTDTLQDVINVPKSVLKKDDTGTYLWKIDDGKAVKAYVDVSSQNGYGAVISNGVKAGDLVVMTGQSRLREGDLVKVVHEGNAVPEGCGS